MKRTLNALVLLGLMAVTSIIFLHQGSAAIRAGSTRQGDDPLNVYAAPLLVGDTAPEIQNIAIAPSTINEGQSATLSFDIFDPDVNESFTVAVQWSGQNSHDTTVTADADGTTHFTATHTFHDDNPSNTSFDVRTVSVTVTEISTKNGNGNGNSAGGSHKLSTTASTTIRVDNLPPTLTGPISSKPAVTVKKPFTLSGTLADEGVNDTFTVTVEWGDGTTRTFNLEHGSGGSVKLKLRHRYKLTGTFDVHMTVEDDDLGTIPRQQVATVTVTPKTLKHQNSPSAPASSTSAPTAPASPTATPTAAPARGRS